ncbi:transposase [Clostridia bacterium]|nr:transposase [Clostridia bacterium]
MTEIQDIHQVIEVLFSQLAAMREELEFVTKENEQLRSENEQLRERLSRYEHPRDSHNSHLPSSKDPIGKKHITLRQKTGRLSGGQKGHPGKTLEMQTPDTLIPIEATYCTCCGADISAVDGEIIERRQQIDIPPIVAVVTEYQRVRKICPCSHVNVVDFPVGVTPGISYGTNIQSLITYFSACQYIPSKRLTRVLDEVFGVKLCEGTIQNVLGRMENRTRFAYETIREKLSHSPVVGVDESSCSVNGIMLWEWVFQNPELTYIQAGLSRKMEEFKKIMPHGMPNTVLVSDCYSGYFSQNVAAHQICTAHVLRDLTFLSQVHEKHSWPKKMMALIRDALHLRKADFEQIDVDRILQRLQVLLNQTIGKKYKKIKTLQKRLRKYQDYLFYFLKDENVPPDNNASERAVRAFKVKLKVSGFFKSAAGAQCFAQLHSIADTARKNNQSPLIAFQSALAI